MKKILLVTSLVLAIMASVGVTQIFAAKKGADIGHTTCTGYGDVLYNEYVQGNTVERSYYDGYMGGPWIGDKTWENKTLTLDTVGVACANDL